MLRFCTLRRLASLLIRTSTVMTSFAALIPARIGSVGIPRKNIKTFLGKPLIGWTIELANKCHFIERVLVSTDDLEIRDVASKYGAETPFLRPSSLARSETPTDDVVKHALQYLADAEGYSPNVILVLEPTSPGRQLHHLEATRDLFSNTSIDSVASISEVPHHYHPEKQLRLLPGSLIEGISGKHPSEMIHRRQDIAPMYAFDGVMFSCRREVLDNDGRTIWGQRSAAFVVEPEYVTDLDLPCQWSQAEEKLRNVLL